MLHVNMLHERIRVLPEAHSLSGDHVDCQDRVGHREGSLQRIALLHVYVARERPRLSCQGPRLAKRQGNVTLRFAGRAIGTYATNERGGEVGPLSP